MARMDTEFNIKFEIEPIVKLGCVNYKCINHLNSRGFACCNLKYITIGQDGKCNDFREREEK